MFGMSELLFYGGLVACGAAMAGAIISAVILYFSKAWLNSLLDREYGKRRS